MRPSLIRVIFLTCLMKPIYSSVLAILTALSIFGILTISTQQVYAPRECGGCDEFKKLTNDFEENVINSITPPNSKTSVYDALPIKDFMEITKDFQEDLIITMESRNVTGGDLHDKPEFVNTYSENVLRIFPNGSIPVLLEDYLENVQRIFGFGP
jgi:hypothetical protein